MNFVHEESDEEETVKPSKRRARKEKLIASTGDGDFADFEEFAHLLEESGGDSGQV